MGIIVCYGFVYGCYGSFEEVGFGGHGDVNGEVGDTKLGQDMDEQRTCSDERSDSAPAMWSDLFCADDEWLVMMWLCCLPAMIRQILDLEMVLEILGVSPTTRHETT